MNVQHINIIGRFLPDWLLHTLTDSVLSFSWIRL